MNCIVLIRKNYCKTKVSKKMSRAIVHIDLDTFYVSCERLINPKLIGLPIIIGGSFDRGVVASCSYEARKFGVRSSMPMKYALRLCPQASLIKGDMEFYSNKSHEITSILNEVAPLVEKAAIDEFYLDLSGMDKFFGCFKWTSELALRIIKETGLPLSFALSINKTVSKIGTGEAKPVGKLEIQETDVKPFLNPLSIQKIPMLGDVTFQLLSRIGIRNIQMLSEMPVAVLQQMIGKNGIEIWKKANGIDNNPVEPYTERKSIATEHTFEKDTTDGRQIKAVIAAMVDKLSYQLRSQGYLVSTVVVKIRYNNFDTETKQIKIPYTSFDHILTKTATEIFVRLYTRRMRLRLIGVRFTGLVRGTHQINMFEETTEMLSLYQAIDKIKNRFGPDSISRSSGSIFKPNSV